MIINSSAKAHSLIKKRISPTVEEVWVLALNSQLKVLDLQLLFRGTVDFCQIHPRDIIRFLCHANASTWIIVHNHPSGDPTPSRQDTQLTRKLWKLSQLVEIAMHDHIIVAGEKFYSYADRGFFEKLKGNSSVLADWKDGGSLEQLAVKKWDSRWGLLK